MTLLVSDRLTDLFASSQPRGTHWLKLLVQLGLDQLPMPGAGATLERWRVLAAVAQFDLSLTKLYEGHTDALAILDEIDHRSEDTEPGAWGVWAAEAPGAKVVVDFGGGDLRGNEGNSCKVRLSGTKYWCSGAAVIDHALLTAWAADASGPSGPYLVAVSLNQPGIKIDASHWKAVGMAGSNSVNVVFDNVQARCVGKLGQYLNRPGFWHGGAGLAACWYGGTVGIALALKQSMLERAKDNSGFKLASLGKIELALDETGANLKQAAAWIDENPDLDASRVAFIARLSAERCAKLVIDEAGKAMGASPFCLNEQFARAAADLPVFIRQTHADKDFAALGERCLGRSANAWAL
jgi:alkylation response protein AidB-like acyl-CoA dehydrogenase